MSEIYVISDTHFGHESILKFGNKKFRDLSCIGAHDEHLLHCWNSVVKPKDVVLHLGDFFWTQKAMEEYLPQLNGRIRWIMGNHDTGMILRTLAKHQNILSVHGVLQKNGLVFSHVPLHSEELGAGYRDWRLNVHGHIHDGTIPIEPSDKYWNANVDVRGAFPTNIKEIYESLS